MAGAVDKYKKDTGVDFTGGDMGSAFTDSSSFIGLDPSMVSEGKLKAGPYGFYKEGRQLKPLQYSPEQRSQIQDVLHQAGFYADKWKSVKLGEWGALDRDAYYQALGEANLRGMSVTDLLNQMKLSPQDLAQLDSSGKPKGPKIPKFSATVINPEDAKILVQRVASDVYGMNADEDTINKIVSGFQGEQKRAQQQEWNAQTVGNGGTTVAAPDISTYAEEQLKNANPQSAEGYGIAKTFNDFLGIIQGAGLGKF